MIDRDISMGVQNVLYDMPGGSADGVQRSELDALREEEQRVSEQASTGHQYGPPAMTVRSSNYISDENLMAWLAQKQNGLYGELRELMDMSSARSKLIEDLNHLKDQVDAGADPEVIVQEANGLLDAYRGTEFEDDLGGLLGRPLGDITTVLESGFEGTDALARKLASDLSAALESKIDALGRDDQLALIEINSLTADIREAAQLVSNLVANNNQTTNTIVGNIGR